MRNMRFSRFFAYTLVAFLLCLFAIAPSVYAAAYDCVPGIPNAPDPQYHVPHCIPQIAGNGTYPTYPSRAACQAACRGVSVPIMPWWAMVPLVGACGVIL